MNKYTMNQRQAREACLIYLYQLLFEKKLADEQAIAFNFEKFLSDNLNNLNYILQEKYKTPKSLNIVDNELVVLIIKKSNDITNFQNFLQNFIDNRDFNSLGLMEQAILILSFIQLKYSDYPYQIIINESIELAKQFCDDNTYKFINGVIDKVIITLNKQSHENEK
ncbi:MAG: transcription antitermination protein NusB [Bacilli bacterium]|nr:transcription antitermination protein NusB [Bacilli bacterium]